MIRKTDKIDIFAPNGEGYILEKWSAEYKVIGDGDARIVQINSLSSITVVISKVLVDWYACIGLPPSYSYYIGVPNFNAATEGYETLQQIDCMASDLVSRGMPKVDAQTVAQVLCHIAALLEEQDNNF